MGLQPELPFAADDGSPDPSVTVALTAYADGTGGAADVLAALAAGRLLVPVVAVLDEAGETPDGVRTDKASHMATVSTTGRDGRRGLLAFTSTEAMQRWNAAARPVAVTTRRAAEAALADGADVLVIDLTGPVSFSVDAGELRALAAGWRPVGGDHEGMTWAVAVGLAADSAGIEPGDEAVAEPPPAAAVVPIERTPSPLVRLARRVAGLARSRRRLWEPDW